MLLAIIGVFLTLFILIACATLCLKAVRWILIWIFETISSIVAASVSAFVSTARRKNPETNVGSTVLHTSMGTPHPVCPKCRSNRVITGQFPTVGGTKTRTVVVANVEPLPTRVEELVGLDLICLNCGADFTCKKNHVRT